MHDQRRVSDMNRNAIVLGAAAAIARCPDRLSVHIQR
jgi:hypothetical protein